jgi:L-ascorbate metabolism protein UlaG (beta-lactamase superfamily)
MTRLRKRWTLVWAVAATVLLVCSIGWPDATQTAVRTLSTLATTPPALAQTPESPAQLEWLGWQFFRLTSLKGKIILFCPALNDPRALFRNRESPLNLDDISAANLILTTDGHADDQGMTVDIAKKTGATVVTTFELATWMVGQGVDTTKILRSQPGFRFDVDGIKIQVVNSVHGSGAPSLPGQAAAVYGGPALGFIVTLENGVKVYHAGSTALTQDLQMYGRLYKPHVALLPISSGMRADDAAIAADFLRTGNPNLHSVFPQHHASFLPPDQQGNSFVKAVESNQALRRQVTPFDPKPGQVFWITGTGTRLR